MRVLVPRSGARLFAAATAALVTGLSVSALTATTSSATVPSTGSTPVSVTAAPADSFVDSMGVNIHLTYTNTVYGNYAGVKGALAGLGMRYVRDQATDSWSSGQQNTQLTDLYTSLGIRTSLIMDPRYSAATTWGPKLQALGGAVWEAEGVNEPDIGAFTIADATSDQQQLWNAVKTNPAIVGLPVASPSWINYGSSTINVLAGALPPIVDRGNFHPYCQKYSPTAGIDSPSRCLASEISAFGTAYGNKPLVATEEGWFTGTNINGGADSETVQAKNLTRMYLENFNSGIVKSFAYELVDEGTDGGTQSSYGLLRNDLTPKPAYTVLQRMISLLADPGATFTPGALSYTLNGATSDVGQLLLQKHDGTFDLVLWNRAGNGIIQNSTDTDNTQAVTLQLATPAAITTVSPTSSASATSVVVTASDPLTVSDAPLIVQITPAAGTATGPAGGTSTGAAGGSTGSTPTTAAPGGGGGSASTTTTTAAPALPGVPLDVLAGATRIATPIAISQGSFAGTVGSAAAGATTHRASSVVLASADDTHFTDALVGTPLALAKNGPVLLTGSNTLDPAVLTEIQRVLSPGAPVYLLGGPSALSPAVETSIQQAGYVPVRFAGTDRFDTAIQVAHDGLGDPTKIIETTGLNFPDALTGGAAAAEIGGAVVLTAGSVQSPETLTYLATHPADVRYAIGGPASQADPSAQSVAGVDRYATGVAVAEQFFPAPPAVGVASGLTFPDALAGGAHAARHQSPLLLTDPAQVPASVLTYLQTVHSTTSFVYGGDAAVSPAARQQISQALAA